MTSIDPRDSLIREALRLYERYQKEVVERFSICPWATAARLRARTRAHVVSEVRCDVGLLGPLLEGWAADTTVDVGFIITPRFDQGADAFAEWSTAIGRSTDGVFVTAPFHPGAPEGAGIVQFLRQTPDPTVQLVRRTTLETIRAQDPPHYADIFELNLSQLEVGKPIRTVAASVLAHNTRLTERVGRESIQAIIDDIREDRNRTYSQLQAW